MTISEQNIINRWNLMASKDLGTEVQPKAQAYAELFKNVFEMEQTQISTKGLASILPGLRGFSVNEQKISVVETYDLGHINISKAEAQELDWYLMNERQWFDRYQYSQTI